MMRFIVATASVFTLLCMTSCNDTQQVLPTAASTHSDSATADPKRHSSTDVEHTMREDTASRSIDDSSGGLRRTSDHSSSSHHVGGDHASKAHAWNQAGDSAKNHLSQSTANAQHHGHHSHRAPHEDVGREHADRVNPEMIAVGDKVPELEVVINGRTWKLSELQENSEFGEDGTLVLTFWCSFCHSCRHVEKDLDQLARQYRGRVAVIALDASAGETAEDVAEFAAKQELTFPIALDAAGVSADVFGTRVTTTTVVIDKAGVLRYRGQFSDGQHSFAQDALHAVLAGQDVPVDETRQKG